MDSSDLEHVLRRTAIPRGQITLLKELYEREDEFVSSGEFVERIRWGDQERFRGVLGAFGNRINETEAIAGRPGIEAFVERERIDGELHYRLRSDAREAVEAVSPLVETFEYSMGTLLEPGTTIEAEKLDP